MKYLEILVKLRKIIRSINLESKRIEKEFGISIPQLLALQFLSEQKDNRAYARDIKTYINLNASTVSGIISRLEQKNLVKKQPHPGDKRATFIVLTDRGADLLKTTPTTLQEKLSGKLQDLSDEEIEALDRNIELLTFIMDVENLDAAPLISGRELPSEQ